MTRHFIFIIVLSLLASSIQAYPTVTTANDDQPPSSTLPETLPKEGVASPTIGDFLINFNIKHLLPNSPFQRFLIHLVRVLAVSLVVSLWMFLVIQLFVSLGKCCQFLCKYFHKRDNGGERDAEETLNKDSVEMIKKAIGKEGAYQKNYVNRAHSMPILVFKK